MHTSPHLPANRILVISILLLLTGCLAGRQVRVSQDPEADFSAYRTWNWIPRHADPDRNPSAEEIELSTRVFGQIRVELARLGLQYRAEEADLGIDAQLIITRERRLTNERVATQTLHSFHMGGSYEIQATRQRITINHKGRLTIRAVDRHRQQEVWRADYEKSVPGGFETAVVAAVETTLARFPAVSDGFDGQETRRLGMYAESRAGAH